MKTPTTTLRLDPKLLDAIDDFIAKGNHLDENVTRSSIIRDAIGSYLGVEEAGFHA